MSNTGSDRNYKQEIKDVIFDQAAELGVNPYDQPASAAVLAIADGRIKEAAGILKDGFDGVEDNTTRRSTVGKSTGAFFTAGTDDYEISVQLNDGDDVEAALRDALSALRNTPELADAHSPADLDPRRVAALEKAAEILPSTLFAGKSSSELIALATFLLDASGSTEAGK